MSLRKIAFHVDLHRRIRPITLFEYTCLQSGGEALNLGVKRFT
jgi:hypothetical protein